MAHTKTHQDIEKEIQKAQNEVKIGGIYAHYKHPENRYKVLALATQEATDNLCIIYVERFKLLTSTHQ